MPNLVETKLVVREFDSPQDYLKIFNDMKSFTESRSVDSEDEIWFVEHNPVYTLGVAGELKHVLNPHQIPVIRTNRGGQVTYHGPGQLVVYPLINLHRKNLFVKEYVSLLEESVIQTLFEIGITNAQRNPGAPGVYIPSENSSLSKIASLGIKVSRGHTYHGLALNVDMDLSPFLGINPCGFEKLKVVDVKSILNVGNIDKIKQILLTKMKLLLKFDC